MSPTESVALSKYIRAHFPQQPLDEYTAEALCELLGRYPAADCRAAVLAIADRGEHWCSPSDVKAEVKRIRAKRIALAGDLCPPPGLSESDERTWLLEARRRIGDGQVVDVDFGELKKRSKAEVLELVQRATPTINDEEQGA